MIIFRIILSVFIFFVIFGLIFWYHTTKKNLPKSQLSIFLLFGLIASLLIPNCTQIANLFVQWKDTKFGVTTALNEIQEAENSALENIKKVVEDHAENIKLLTRDLNTQTESFDEFIDISKKDIIDLKNEIEKTKNEIEQYGHNIYETSLLLVKSLYLIISTKNELGGGQRNQVVIDTLNKDINDLLGLVIPDNKVREKWVQDLNKILPPK